jgi:hypothetical protein
LEDFDPSKLKPNWKDQEGALYHHADVVAIKMKNKSVLELVQIANQLHRDMTRFRDFNSVDNPAKALLKDVGGDRYIGFKMETFSGWASRRISGDGDSSRHWVRVLLIRM